MATTNITIRIDEKLKTELQKLLTDLGLDMTTFFTMAAKQAVREQGLPFRPHIDVPNMETLKAMAEIEYLTEHPEIPRKTYGTAEEMMEDILSESNL